eukprot:TRINITY_DN53537_c0_g1_i1.p1 TRINITY_DN53537_c0_g1~~TRINITY_DN53537_c0_g1_i1.p1  ORF type:complete len:209 (+),score=9.71 TRINITY_DN53537_c0_g1_i1:38-664(+)
MVVTWLLLGCVVAASGLECTPNADHGCINGYPYDRRTQEICGRTEGEKQPIYTRATWGCCAEGLPFQRNTHFCCYDGIHKYSVGKCEPWSDNEPAQCECPASADRNHTRDMEAQELVQATIPEPINTNHPNPTPCRSADATDGCLNGWKYAWASQYPCGYWIIDFKTHGCCDGTPYALASQSCCFYAEKYVVRNESAHACGCEKHSCL